MNTKIKRFLTIVFALLLAVASATTAFAHSGRTDSSGGHRDNKNNSKVKERPGTLFRPLYFCILCS